MFKFLIYDQFQRASKIFPENINESTFLREMCEYLFSIKSVICFHVSTIELFSRNISHHTQLSWPAHMKTIDKRVSRRVSFCLLLSVNAQGPLNCLKERWWKCQRRSVAILRLSKFQSNKPRRTLMWLRDISRTVNSSSNIFNNSFKTWSLLMLEDLKLLLKWKFKMSPEEKRMKTQGGQGSRDGGEFLEWRSSLDLALRPWQPSDETSRMLHPSLTESQR